MTGGAGQTAEDEHQHGEEVDQGGVHQPRPGAEIVRDKDEGGVQAEEGAVEEGAGQSGYTKESEKSRSVN